MNLDDRSLEIENMRQRVAFLQRELEQPEVKKDIELLVAVFEELHQAIEELQIAQEDLQQQNEELSRTQQALLVQQQRYQELFEEAPEAYVVTNMEGIIEEANAAATTLLNISKSFLIGEPLHIYIVEEEQINFDLQLWHLRATAGIKEWEVKLRPRNRTPIITAVKVAAIRHQPSHLVGLRWVLRDITTAKQTAARLQRAEEAMRQAFVKEKKLSELKSQLIVTASHEFRNPLAIIQSSAELLEHYRHQWSDERQLTHLRRIQQSVMHMTHLLNDFFVLSQNEAGQLEFNPVPLNLVEFCREVLEELQQDYKLQQAIALITDYECIQDYFDAQLLRHILNNLISNALKYSANDSQIKFSITCIPNHVILEIQDFGIGIPPGDIQYIFEPFHRASNVENIPGMGLGMSIVKKAVDLHKGEITVKTAVGIGTTFTLTFPISNDVHILNSRTEKSQKG